MADLLVNWTSDFCLSFQTNKLGEDWQYSAEEQEDNDLYFTCPVCMLEMACETIEQSGRVFCKGCILDALLEKEFCPIPPFGEEEDDDSASDSDSDSDGNETSQNPIN